MENLCTTHAFSNYAFEMGFYRVNQPHDFAVWNSEPVLMYVYLC